MEYLAEELADIADDIEALQQEVAVLAAELAEIEKEISTIQGCQVSDLKQNFAIAAIVVLLFAGILAATFI